MQTEFDDINVNKFYKLQLKQKVVIEQHGKQMLEQIELLLYCTCNN